jgi:hypothetical protein
MKKSDVPLLDVKIQMRLLRASANLSPIEGWEPVGCLLEEVRLVLHNSGGITEEEYLKFLSMEQAWTSLDERLQTLYRACISNAETETAASAGLYSIFFGTGSLSGSAYSLLSRQWEDLNGYPPPTEIAPFVGEAK